MKSTLNKPELVLLLQQQIIAIEMHCNGFDDGDESVIHVIAEKIVAIFHNTNQSKALVSLLKLGHLDIYCSSEIYNPKSLTNFIGLLKLAHRVGKGWSYAAKLDRAGLTTVSQENWWSNKKVIIDSDGNAFTRSKIIKSLANNDLLILDTSGWIIKDAEGNKSTINPIAETVRQIAFELLESFRGIDLSRESELYYKA